MAEFKTSEDFEEAARKAALRINTILALEHSSARTLLLFSKSTLNYIENLLLDAYKEGWDDRTKLNL